MNQKLSKDSCKPSPFYTSRCKCFKQSQPCSSLCHCKSCLNPYGRKEERIPPRNSRKKRRHECQVDIPDSKRFAESRGESISMSTWSDFEALVLSEVVKHFSEKLKTKSAILIQTLQNCIMIIQHPVIAYIHYPPVLFLEVRALMNCDWKNKIHVKSHYIKHSSIIICSSL